MWPQAMFCGAYTRGAVEFVWKCFICGEEHSERYTFGRGDQVQQPPEVPEGWTLLFKAVGPSPNKITTLMELEQDVTIGHQNYEVRRWHIAPNLGNILFCTKHDLNLMVDGQSVIKVEAPNDNDSHSTLAHA